MVDSITVTTRDGTQLIIGDGENDINELKKIAKSDGINSITYTNMGGTSGTLEVGAEDLYGDEITEDKWEQIEGLFSLLPTIDEESGEKLLKYAQKNAFPMLQGLAEFLDKNIEQSLNPTPTQAYSHTTLTDYDIRELMKLLIKAFSELINAQRQVALSNINGIIQALNEKISAMEKSRDENHKAAIHSAIGQIAMGVLQIVGGFASTGSSASSIAKKFKSSSTWKAIRGKKATKVKIKNDTIEISKPDTLTGAHKAGGAANGATGAGAPAAPTAATNTVPGGGAANGTPPATPAAAQGPGQPPAAGAPATTTTTPAAPGQPGTPPAAGAVPPPATAPTGGAAGAGAPAAPTAATNTVPGGAAAATPAAPAAGNGAPAVQKRANPNGNDAADGTANAAGNPPPAKKQAPSDTDGADQAKTPDEAAEGENVKGNTTGENPTDSLLLESQVKAQKTLTRCQMYRELANAAGTILNSIMSIISSNNTSEAKTAEIASMMNDAVLELRRKMSDETGNQQKALEDFIASLIKIMSELVSSTNSAELSAATRA